MRRTTSTAAILTPCLPSLVIGNPGSGKSTLALELARRDWQLLIPATNLSDVLGTSGRAGTTHTEALADLAQGRLRDTRAGLERAVDGRMGAHQRFLLAEQLAHYDALNESIDRISAEIAERVRPFESLIDRLDPIPGVGRRVAEVL